MAITATLSQAELQRVAALAYEGLPIRVSLANDTFSAYDVEDTVATWDGIKVSGNGYADFRAVLGTGSYDPSDGRYEMPYIDAEFSATGAGFAYNSIYIVLGTFTSKNLSTVAVASNVVTLTTTTSHGLTTGDIVYITTSPASDYEGWRTVTGTPSSTEFTYSAILPDAGPTAITGTAKKLTEATSLHSLLIENPTKDLAAGQTQTYRILLATDN